MFKHILYNYQLLGSHKISVLIAECVKEGYALAKPVNLEG